MILTHENWSLGYEQILRDARTASSFSGTAAGMDTHSVLLLVAPTTDALCAAKIVTHMLRSDEIPHTLLPCYTQEDLRLELRKHTQQHGDTCVSAIICLDCGASVNLIHAMGAEGADTVTASNTKVYCIDSHRPVHLANVYAGLDVVLYLEHGEDLVSDGDDLSGNEDSDEDALSGNEDSDSDGGSSIGVGYGYESRRGLGNEDEGEEEWSENETSISAAKWKLDETAETTSIMTEDNDDNSYDDSMRPSMHDDDDMKDAVEDGDEDSVDDDASLEGEEDPQQGFKPFEREQDTFIEQSRSRRRRRRRREGDNDIDKNATNRLTQQEQYMERKQRIRSYYSTTYYGAPVSFVAWNLCSTLRFGSSGDLLWYSCVGKFDIFLTRLDE